MVEDNKVLLVIVYSTDGLKWDKDIVYQDNVSDSLEDMKKVKNNKGFRNEAYDEEYTRCCMIDNE